MIVDSESKKPYWSSTVLRVTNWCRKAINFDREHTMPRKKEPEKYAVVGPKDCWHLYALQVLAPKKFAQVVGEIMSGRHTLVKTRVQDRPVL